MYLSYGELEDFLAKIHGVVPEKRTALKGRLKHFQRLGWPAGTNKGKGARVQYGIGQTMCLAVGMEMLQLGLTPERVVDHFKFGAETVARAFAAALDDYGPYADPIYYIFAPESLSALRGDDFEESGFVSLTVSRDKIAELFSPGHLLINLRRFAFINLTEILDQYLSEFVPNGLGAPVNLQEAMENWAQVEKELFRKAAIRRGGVVFDGD